MSFDSVKQWVEFFRDIGLIIGIPGIFFLGCKIFNSHIQALKDSHKAHIDALGSENRLLKETQYDRALSIIEAQKKIIYLERKRFESEISKLKLEKDDLKNINKIIDNNFVYSSSMLEQFIEKLKSMRLVSLEAEVWEDFLDRSISEASLAADFKHDS
jgi:hypothetical protein